MRSQGLAVRQMATSLIAYGGIVVIHHAYESGRYLDPSKLAGVAVPTIMLPITLALLDRYTGADARRARQWFDAIVLFYWVGITGVVNAGFQYVIKDALFVTRAVSTETLAAIFPLEHIPPDDIFHEGTGVLIFVFAIWVTVAWRRLRVAPSAIAPPSDEHAVAAA